MERLRIFSEFLTDLNSLENTPDFVDTFKLNINELAVNVYSAAPISAQIFLLITKCNMRNFYRYRSLRYTLRP